MTRAVGGDRCRAAVCKEDSRAFCFAARTLRAKTASKKGAHRPQISIVLPLHRRLAPSFSDGGGLVAQPPPPLERARRGAALDLGDVLGRQGGRGARLQVVLDVRGGGGARDDGDPLLHRPPQQHARARDAVAPRHRRGAARVGARGRGAAERSVRDDEDAALLAPAD